MTFNRNPKHNNVGRASKVKVGNARQVLLCTQECVIRTCCAKICMCVCPFTQHTYVFNTIGSPCHAMSFKFFSILGHSYLVSVKRCISLGPVMACAYLPRM